MDAWILGWTCVLWTVFELGRLQAAARGRAARGHALRVGSHGPGRRPGAAPRRPGRRASDRERLHAQAVDAQLVREVRRSG